MFEDQSTEDPPSEDQPTKDPPSRSRRQDHTTPTRRTTDRLRSRRQDHALNRRTRPCILVATRTPPTTPSFDPRWYSDGQPLRGWQSS